MSLELPFEVKEKNSEYSDIFSKGVELWEQQTGLGTDIFCL